MYCQDVLLSTCPGWSEHFTTQMNCEWDYIIAYNYSYPIIFPATFYHFRSVNPGSSPIHAGVAAVPGAIPEDDSTLLLSDTDGGCMKKLHARDKSSGGTQQTSAEHEPGHEATELQDFVAQNRRLLPNLKNPLHVIDGPEQRYFIGIIDIFTVYSFKKRLEHLWKRLRHPGRSFSTVSPETYCLRLCHWVQDHTK